MLYKQSTNEWAEITFEPVTQVKVRTFYISWDSDGADIDGGPTGHENHASQSERDKVLAGYMVSFFSREHNEDPRVERLFVEHEKGHYDQVLMVWESDQKFFQNEAEVTYDWGEDQVTGEIVGTDPRTPIQRLALSLGPYMSEDDIGLDQKTFLALVRDRIHADLSFAPAPEESND